MWCKMYFLIILIMICIVEITTKDETVDKNHDVVTRFPHVAFLRARCPTKSNPANPGWSCGASIINQMVILTAAHCVDRCSDPSTISIYVGHDHKYQGIKSSAHSYLTHEKYDYYTADCDIALVRLNTELKYSLYVRRVALMPSPPIIQEAEIAAWDLGRLPSSSSETLRVLSQRVSYLGHMFCPRRYRVPVGSFCAEKLHSHNGIRRGDSGSALVILGYIQVGIASYIVPEASDNVAIYTDTSYYYDWITDRLEKVYCGTKQ